MRRFDSDPGLKKTAIPHLYGILYSTPVFIRLPYIMPKTKRWTEKDLRNAVLISTSVRQVLYKLGLIPAGGNYAQIKKYIKELNINTKHFKGMAWNRGMKFDVKPRIALEDILIKNSSFQSFKLKKRLFKLGLKKIKCEECGWAELSKDGRIPLELDHINGEHQDNRLENLRILCPNCHSLKTTHRGRNKGK